MPASLSPPQSRRWQFTVKSLLALCCVAALGLVWIKDRLQPPVVDAAILASGAVQVRFRLGGLDGRADSHTALVEELMQVKRAINERGVPPHQVAVQISVDNQASSRQLKELILICVDIGMTEFHVRVNADTLAHFNLADFHDYKCEELLAPIRVQLQADAAGRLNQVLLGDRVSSLANVQREIHNIVTDGGRFPIGAQYDVVLVPDDTLRFEHLAVVWEQVGWYTEPSGRRVPLVPRVMPFPAHASETAADDPDAPE
jgi:hypothetical protein